MNPIRADIRRRGGVIRKIRNEDPGKMPVGWRIRPKRGMDVTFRAYCRLTKVGLNGEGEGAIELVGPEMTIGVEIHLACAAVRAENDFVVGNRRLRVISFGLGPAQGALRRKRESTDTFHRHRIDISVRADRDTWHIEGIRIHRISPFLGSIRVIGLHRRFRGGVNGSIGTDRHTLRWRATHDPL